MVASNLTIQAVSSIVFTQKTDKVSFDNVFQCASNMTQHDNAHLRIIHAEKFRIFSK